MASKSLSLYFFERRTKMKAKKIAQIVLTASFAISLFTGAVCFAADSKAYFNNVSMENSFLSLNVEQDKREGEYLRYKLSTTGGKTYNDEDDNKNITYRNFYSGYTTLCINGSYYEYGRGEDIGEPKYDIDNRCHISAQKFGDVIIEQTLAFSEVYTPDYEDMLRISYKVISAGENDSIGVRILIDPMLSGDDVPSVRVDNTPVSNEAVFSENIPDSWSVTAGSNEKIAAYGKTNTDENTPDSLIFADWGVLYDAVWEYTPDINSILTDTAAAVKWEPESNVLNKEFVTYYGIRNDVNTGDDSKVRLVSSPDTSDSFPVRSIIMLVVSGVSAAGSIVLRRKEKR